MATTIQISDDLQKELSKKKLYDRETYEEILWNLIEDTMELSEQTKKDIEQSRKEIIEGKTVSLEEIKKKFILLTRGNNLLKSRGCEKCSKTGKRGNFPGIYYWYKGGNYWE